MGVVVLLLAAAAFSYGVALTLAKLAYTFLVGANLTRADLTDANLTRADLTGADLTHAV